MAMKFFKTRYYTAQHGKGIEKLFQRYGKK